MAVKQVLPPSAASGQCVTSDVPNGLRLILAAALHSALGGLKSGIGPWGFRGGTSEIPVGRAQEANGRLSTSYLRVHALGTQPVTERK